MFQMLLDLGRTVAKRQGRTEVCELLRDPIPEEYKSAVVITFDATSYGYVGSESVRLSPSERDDILYKKGPPNGYDATTVSFFGGATERTVKRVGKSLQAIADWKGPNADESAVEVAFTRLSEAYDGSIEQISEDVSASVATLELNVENRGLLLVALQRDRSRHPVWQSNAVRQFIVDRSMAQYGSYGDTPCQQSEAECCVCMRRRALVFGNFSELKSYILDKPGMIAGGFDVEHAARNFPVCAECAAHVALGINYAETRLTFRMAGQSYLMLPQCFEDSIRDEFIDICEARETRQTDSLHEDSLIRIKEDEEEMIRITDDKDEIFQEVAKRFATSDRISLKLVFFEKEKAAWKICAEVDQVLPSRIRDILAAKQDCEQRPWRNERDFVSTDLVREFAGGSFTNSNRIILAHLDAVFAGKLLEANQVLRNIVDHLLGKYKSDVKSAGFAVGRAFLLYDFYRKLRIIPSDEGEPMNNAIADKSAYGRFLDENAEFFDASTTAGCAAKRVAFLTGALVRCVMTAQYERLNSTPFEKKLKGMRVSKDSLKKLLGDSEHKLQVYDKDHFHRDLLELLSQQWVATKGGFDISDDEATFCFALGLNLNYYVTSTYGKQGETK